MNITDTSTTIKTTIRTSTTTATGPQRRMNDPKRAPQFTNDEAGQPIVLVPLQRPGWVAQLDADDWEHLQGLGLSPLWVLNSAGNGSYSYVRTTQRGDTRTLVSVAPVLLAVGRNEQVTYRDGNPLNLRRENLRVVPRAGRKRKSRGPARLGYHPDTSTTVSMTV